MLRTFRVFTATLFALLALPTLAEAQAPDFIREMLREKMRFTPEQLRTMRQKSREQEGSIASAAGSTTNTVVSADRLPESEVHAAINPLDSNNIIVSAIRSGSSPEGGLVCPIYFTRDFGVTWRKSSFINLPVGESIGILGGGDPIFAFDTDGRAYFSWINMYMDMTAGDSIYFSLFWCYSDDGGETWTRPKNEIIGSGAATFADFGALEVFDKQWMAVDRTDSPWRNTLYCVFMQARGDGSFVQIGLRKKDAGSEEFTKTSIPISGAEAVQVQFASIAIDPEGGVNVSYFGVDGSGQCSMWHSRSIDGGETFSPGVKVADLHIPKFSGDATDSTVSGLSRIQPCPHLAIDNSNGPNRGNLYVIWTADGTTSRGEGGLDVFLSRSTDKGASWSQPILVNDDDREKWTHQFHPSIAVNSNGVVSATWYDRRGDSRNLMTNYYISHSFDGGRSFGASAPVSSNPTDFSTVESANGGFGIGEYNQLLSLPGYAIPVWADGRGNSGNLDIYIAFVPIGTSSVIADRAGAIESGSRIHAPVQAGNEMTVGISLEQGGAVKLMLVDMLGQTVKQIADESLPSGDHRYNVETGSLASGRYFLALRTGNGQTSRQIEIVR